MVMIFGAGMAGLLAGCVFRGGTIFETQQELPNNHHALLRFRSSVVGDYLGIPFRQVDVMKWQKPWRNPVADALSYSEKANGVYGFRSSTTADGSISQRFIAPPDFIQKMSDAFSGDIKFGAPSNCLAQMAENNLGQVGCGTPIISTIPMPILMEALNYNPRPNFKYREAWVIEAEFDMLSKACATIYYPEQGITITRATLTDNKLQIELTEEPPKTFVNSIIKSVADDFGIRRHHPRTYTVKEQTYGKIESIDDRERRKFIMWATDNFNIYSLGRFATWKPGLLLDDVLTDLFKVRKMIQTGDNYDGRLPATEEGEK